MLAFLAAAAACGSLLAPSFAAAAAAPPPPTPQPELRFARLPQFSALSPPATARSSAAGACPDHPPALPFADGAVPESVAAAVSAATAIFTAPLNSTSLPGVSYDFRYGATVLSRGASGTADRARGTAMAADTLLRIGSITKSFVALLAFKAAALGLLSLDAPLAASAPSFAVRDPWSGGNGSDITWRHLLTQRSGLQREPPPGASTAAVLAALASTLLIAPVGNGPSYSNLGFALCGHLLAEAVFPGGRPLEALLAEHILAPLGLSDTGVAYTPAVLARLAPSYSSSGAAVPHAELGWLWPAGAMYASAQNLSSLGAALLAAAAPAAPADGSASPLGLPPALARQALDVAVLLADGVTLVSAPWESALLTPRGYVARSKGGNVEAYSATLTLVPDAALAFAALYNGGADEGALADAAAAALLPPLADALAASAPPPDQGPAPAQYEGTYACATPGAAPDAYVLQQGGYLMLVVPGFLSAPLAWVGAPAPDAFRVYIPPGTLSCEADFELAIRGEIAVFGRDAASQRVVSVAMPGWAPGLAWQRA